MFVCLFTKKKLLNCEKKYYFDSVKKMNQNKCKSNNQVWKYCQIVLYIASITIAIVTFNLWKKQNVETIITCMKALLVLLIFNFTLFVYRFLVLREHGFGTCVNPQNIWRNSILFLMMSSLFIFTIWASIDMMKKLWELQSLSEKEIQKQMSDNSKLTTFYNVISFAVLFPIILSFDIFFDVVDFVIDIIFRLLDKKL